MRMQRLVIICTLVCALFLQCGGRNPLEVEGNWVSDIPFRLGDIDLQIFHDNHIYETEHFLVFSDAATDDVRIRFAAHAERALEELLEAWGIPNAAALGIVDVNTKITIFTNTNLLRSQVAFPYGFILYGEDSYRFSLWPISQQKRFYNEIKHETAHVIQYLMGIGVPPNSRVPGQEPDRWFNEGLAEYLCGGFVEPITTRIQFEQWRRARGHENPIAIHLWSDLPVSVSEAGEYYPVFAIAVQYLLDDDGMGKSLQDIKNMFALLAIGETSFADAFGQYMGISLAEYEATFFDRMAEYLD